MMNGNIDFALIGLDPPPRGFGEWIEQRYDGVWDVKLVIMKGLTLTDLSRNHNRISVPENLIIDGDFLTAEEKDLLAEGKREGSGTRGIPVKLYGPVEGECTDVVLDKWKLSKSACYVLKKGWMSLVGRFRDVFRLNAIVQLWSFRTAADGELAFHINKIGQLEDGGEFVGGIGDPN